MAEPMPGSLLSRVRRPDPDREWERFGREDPYFGVYSDDRFRSDRLDEEARADFFASGEMHIDAAMDLIQSDLDPGFAPRRALELGCGVGRLLVPLSQRCEEVVGVDISEPMVREARHNLAERGIQNVTVLRVDASLSGVAGPFDWVHSFIVLQHVPARRGMRLVQRLVDLLGEGGIGVLHLTFDSDLSRRSRLVRWARQSLPLVHTLWNRRYGLPGDAPWMEMNRYDLNRVFRQLQDEGCHRTVARFTNHFGHRGIVLFFKKEPQPGFP